MGSWNFYIGIQVEDQIWEIVDEHPDTVQLEDLDFADIIPRIQKQPSPIIKEWLSLVSKMVANTNLTVVNSRVEPEGVFSVPWFEVVLQGPARLADIDEGLQRASGQHDLKLVAHDYDNHRYQAYDCGDYDSGNIRDQDYSDILSSNVERLTKLMP